MSPKLEFWYSPPLFEISPKLQYSVNIQQNGPQKYSPGDFGVTDHDSNLKWGLTPPSWGNPSNNAVIRE